MTQASTEGKMDLSQVPFEPYYRDEHCVIYNADCMSVIPFLPMVDITFSSPPYNQIPETAASGLMAESPRKLNGGYETHADDMPEQEYQNWMRDVFGACRAVSRGLVWVNHKTRYRDRAGIHPLQIFSWPFYSEVVWDRGGSLTLNARKFAPSHEFIYGFGTPHYWDSKLNTRMSVWRVNPEREVSWHPCPFPESIVSACIVASCPEGGWVLDPFGGSMTTASVARAEGRRAICCEINEAYCEKGVKRLEQGVLF